VHHLFADKGVVILDADDKNLKQAFIPYIKKDIMEQSNFKTLHQTNLQLKKHYKTQVNGREINFFYLSDKGRSLIKQDKGNFYVEDTDLTFSVDELEKEIESNPEKFSPNVILRPLYQEVILPNLSYIGGPGEIAYWLQLKDVFASNQVASPILTLRSFVLLLREQHYNQLNKLGLSPIDLFMTPIDIERKLVALNNDGGQKDISLQFDQYLQQLIDIANKTDNQISSELIAHKTEWKKKLVHLNQKLDQKQREKVKLKSDKAIRIQQEYFKGHTMQERYENMLTYGINRDVKQFIEVVFNAVSHNTQGIHNIVIQG
jgi:bacillithiol biosynthesis cysteine-adding enzyme BshC